MGGKLRRKNGTWSQLGKKGTEGAQSRGSKSGVGGGLFSRVNVEFRAKGHSRSDRKGFLPSPLKAIREVRHVSKTAKEQPKTEKPNGKLEWERSLPVRKKRASSGRMTVITWNSRCKLPGREGKEDKKEKITRLRFINKKTIYGFGGKKGNDLLHFGCGEYEKEGDVRLPCHVQFNWGDMRVKKSSKKTQKKGLVHPIFELPHWEKGCAC